MKRLIDRIRDAVVTRLFRSAGALKLAPGEPQWAAGDVAECICEGPWRLASGQPGIGPVYLEIRCVDRVVIEPHAHTGELVQFLVFARYGRDLRYEAIAFRKIEPRADAAIPAAAAWLNSTRELHSPLESEMS